MIGGEPRIVKVHTDGADWISRIVGDEVFWPLVLWRHGLFDRVPAEIDHAVLTMAYDPAGPEGPARFAILMHDVGPHLVPEGDDPVTVDDDEGLLDGMAALHAAFWGWRDDLGLLRMERRVRSFSPAIIAPELERPVVPGPIQVADEGWRRLPDLAPALDRVATALHADPSALVAALETTPTTFLHGDWKMGNLGRHPDGRTILLDWAYPGEGPACWDLAWYLALNRARLPRPKEACIASYRGALEQHGVDTAGWFEVQLELCLLAIMVMFGWEKAVGDAAELAWWDEAAARGLARVTALTGWAPPS